MAGVVLAALLPATCARHQPARETEVMHWWVSGGEAAAIRVVADAFNARGGHWQDNAIASSDVATPAINSRIAGGTPPDAAQVPLGTQNQDYVRNGLLEPLDQVARKSKLLENIPDFVRQSAVFADGHVYVLPIIARGETWLWYNKQVLVDAGAKEPATWDEFFAALDAVRARGQAVPLAIGMQPWQMGLAFRSVLVTREGAETYLQVYRDLNVEAIRSPAFRDAFNTFIRLRRYTDDGAANREWNASANMLMTGKAAFHLMGDWEKGEFTAAGLVPGRDVGCQILHNGNGIQYFVVGADSFVFPVTHSGQRRADQMLLAGTMIDRQVQVDFSAKKGSIPIRRDVDIGKLDVCSQMGARLMKQPDRVLPIPDFMISPAMLGEERDLTARAWVDPTMDADAFASGMIQILERERASRLAHR